MENTKEKKQFQVAEIQLSYKSNVKPSLRPKINSSKEARDILMEYWDDSKIELLEQFIVILAENASLNLLGIEGNLKYPAFAMPKSPLRICMMVDSELCKRYSITMRSQ